MVAVVVAFPTYLVLTLTHNLMVAYAAAFCFGLATIARLSGGFLLLMEVMPTKWQPVAGGIGMVAESLSLILWVIFLTQINQNAQYFMMYGALLNGVLIIPICYLTESPRWLYGMGNFEKCSEVLTKIAAWNGYKDY